MDIYKKCGIVVITDDLELKDFVWWVDWINEFNLKVDLPSGILKVEVFMRIDGGNKIHSRMMPIPLTGEVSQSYIIDQLLSLPQFQGSTLITE
jgi:hypothetical protein